MKNRGTWGDRPKRRKALWISLGIFTIQQFCGSAALVAYAQTIFDITDSHIEPYKATIYVGCVQVATCCLSVLLVDRVGRKPLLLLSALGVGLMNGVLGTYFYFYLSNKESVAILHWLPIAAMMIYIICYAVGLSTVPYVIIGEMFPTNVKLYASCVAHIYTRVIRDTYYGIYTVFWGFCVCSILGLVFILAVLPETKGKSFACIQAQLKREVARDNASKLMTVEY